MRNWEQTVLYKAFISYSHAADGKLAPALQSALHRFAKPWYQLRAIRVFRDKTSLSVSPALWPSIEKSLSDSEYFILMASPDSAASYWVQQEVDYWLRSRPSEKILIVLTDGVLAWDRSTKEFNRNETTAIPPNLQHAFTDEPLYLDLRWARTEQHLSLDNPTFHESIAELAAPLHGRPKDEIIGEDINQHKRTKLVAWSAITALLILTLLSVLAGYFAVQQRNRAVQEAQIALGRQFAAQATTALINNNLDSGLLYAVKAFRTYNNFDTRDSLLSALEQSPKLITLLRGHASGLNAPEVHDIAFHPNGHILASAGEDRRVILWDVETRQRLGQEFVRHPNNAIRHIAFSPDGEQLATIGLDGAWVWKVDDGSEITKLNGRHGELSSLAFSPDGKLLATGDCIKVSNRACVEGQVMLWDTHIGQPRGASFMGHTGWVTSVAFHPNGQLLASASSDGTIQIWNVLTGQRIGDPLRGHARSVYAVAFSPDGKILASSSADRTIRLWNSATRQLQGDLLIGHAGTVTSVTFSADGTLLASASEDKTIRLWEVSTGKPVGEPIRGHRDTVNAVAFSPKGQLLASGGGDNIVMFADPTSSPIAVQLDDLERGSKGLVFSPDARLLASGGSGGVIKVWDVAQRKQYGTWVVAQGSREIRDESGRVTGWSSSHLFIEALAFHPNGKLLASASLDGLLELRDVATGQRVGEPFRHPGEVRSLAFSPNGKMLASAGSRASVVLWDVELHKPIATLKGHRMEEPGVNAPNILDVYSVAFSPDGKTLASGSFDKTIIFWDVSAKKSFRPPLVGHEAWVDSIAFRPDGRVLASADVDGVILMWDTATGQRLGSGLRMPEKGYTRIAFSPDGKTLAACSGHLVMLWELSSGEAISHPFKGPVGQVESVAFSPDNKTIATGDHDGRVLLWDISLDSWSARACMKANRNFTAEEWAHVAPGVPYEKICPQLPFHVSAVEQMLKKAKAAGKAQQKASELYSEALDRAIETDDADLNNRVCWFGSIDGVAQTVLSACDRAVKLAPRYGGWRDTRAIARALVGDQRGAVEDLQFFVQWAQEKSEYQQYVPKRKQWITELMVGRNPFDAKTLGTLRDEE